MQHASGPLSAASGRIPVQRHPPLHSTLQVLSVLAPPRRPVVRTRASLLREPPQVPLHSSRRIPLVSPACPSTPPRIRLGVTSLHVIVFVPPSIGGSHSRIPLRETV